jgi:hypothetical protein
MWAWEPHDGKKKAISSGRIKYAGMKFWARQ